MPWIHVTVSAPVAQADLLATELATAAAAATGLGPGDVVVLVTVADASAGPGAVVVVSGRPRSETAEQDLADAVRAVVAASVGLDVDLVAVVRS